MAAVRKRSLSGMGVEASRRSAADTEKTA